MQLKITVSKNYSSRFLVNRATAFYQYMSDTFVYAFVVHLPVVGAILRKRPIVFTDPLSVKSGFSYFANFKFNYENLLIYVY